MGHGAYFSALAQTTTNKYDPCQPLQEGSTELLMATHACGEKICMAGPMLSLQYMCAEGLYHAIMHKIPSNDFIDHSWPWPLMVIKGP